MKTKKTMKTIIAAVLVAAALLTLVGCKPESDNLIDGCYDYDIDSIVTLGQYKEIVIEVDDPTATDAEIEAGFNALLNEGVTYTQSDTDVLAMGDIADITFEGFLDGVKQDNMSGSTADLQLGTGKLIPGFEEGLVGLKKGDRVTLNLTFPENYRSTDLRGRDAVFNVVIDKVQKQFIPELTDEFVSEHSEYKTVDEYREYLKVQIKSDKEKKNESEFENRVWSKAVLNATIDEESRKYPSRLADEIAKDNLNYMTQVIMLYYQMSIEEYCQQLGFTVEEFTESAKEDAKDTLNSQMVIYAVCKAEGITLTQAEYDELVPMYVEECGVESVEELETQYSKNDIITDMAFSKMLAFLMESATMTIKEN